MSMWASHVVTALAALAASLHTCAAMKPMSEAATAYTADYKDLYPCILNGEDICAGVFQFSLPCTCMCHDVWTNSAVFFCHGQ